MNPDLPSFNENYQILRDIAETLRAEENEEVPDIDNLLDKVERASTAYKACKSRLDAVERALTDLQEEGESSQET